VIVRAFALVAEKLIGARFGFLGLVVVSFLIDVLLCATQSLALINRNYVKNLRFHCRRKENAYRLMLWVKVSEASVFGRVDQPGMIATLASWRPRVQIPLRPPNPLSEKRIYRKKL
jgi:hypothetical protein